MGRSLLGWGWGGGEAILKNATRGHEKKGELDAAPLREKFHFVGSAARRSPLTGFPLII